ncbi:MAG: 50S ribosomal protein L31e [Nanoarchaeota archaeon]|nr:50S ribosomal protein L31e [Nanoarchaeota archaeon]
MKELDRIYTIPLRREYMKVPKYKRAKKAITAIKQFLKKHMKSENIKLGKQLNLKIWERGIKNPPHHIKVTVKKDGEGLVTAELFGFDFVDKRAKKEKEPGNLKEKLAEKIKGTANKKAESDVKKAEDKKPVEKKTEVKVEAKPVKEAEKPKETPVKDKEE